MTEGSREEEGQRKGGRGVREAGRGAPSLPEHGNSLRRMEK